MIPSAIVQAGVDENKRDSSFELTLTVNSPVTASKPTCTVCSKFVGYEMLGFESLCDCFDLILFFSVFFLRSGSSGSVGKRKRTYKNEFHKNPRLSPLGSGLRSGGPSNRSLPPRLLVSRTGGAGGLSSSLDILLASVFQFCQLLCVLSPAHSISFHLSQLDRFEFVSNCKFFSFFSLF